MDRVVLLIKWIWRMWPVLLPVVIGLGHYYGYKYLAADWVELNKLISLSLQIVGGLLVLYSIDSNLGIVSNSSLYSVLSNYFKSFPLIKRHYTLQVDSSVSTTTVNSPKLRVHGPKNTVEEKIENLEKQIEWLNEDLGNEVRSLREQISQSENRAKESIEKVQSKLGVLDSKLKGISTGGFEIQVFGVLLVIYGAVVGYHA